jgi:DNA-binding SARP family transcriptional activator
VIPEEQRKQRMIDKACRLLLRAGRPDLVARLGDDHKAAASRHQILLFGSRPGLIFAGRETPERWRLRRVFQALAFLVLQHDHQASRDQLVAALWSRASREAVRKNFHPTISELRRLLAGADPPLHLSFANGLYRLEKENQWDCDVHQFRRSLGLADQQHSRGMRREAIAALRSAWSLYRGPLLAELDEDWLTLERRACHRDFVRLLGQLGDLAEIEGDDGLALDSYRALLIAEPGEESIHVALMRLYSRQGRRDLVRRQYVRLQDELKDLNVEPLAATQEEFHRLMR